MKLDRDVILRRIRLTLIAWASASLFFTAVLMLSDFGGHKSLGFVLYSNALHVALWACILPVILKAASLLPLTGERRSLNGVMLLPVIAVLAALVAFTHLAIVYVTYFPYRSVYPSFPALLRSELIRFMPFDTVMGMVIVVAFAGWKAWQAFLDERARANDLERQLAVAKLEALRMQLHPHFLFNTLHTVAGLTVEAPATARRVVIALGDLLRITLKDVGGKMRTLAEELEYADLYLGIEKIRIGDRLVLHYEIDPSATRALVPQSLLQPLFENAVRHGASRIVGPCEIRFRACCKSDSLDIMIRNDGPKRDSSPDPPRLGVGLTNTLDRLRLYYGDRYTFNFVARPEGGAQVDVSFPYRVDADGADVSIAVVESSKAHASAGAVVPSPVSTT